MTTTPPGHDVSLRDRTGDETVSRTGDDLDRLRKALEDAAELLPTQGPITVFVHHNTLHCLEHLPFAEAVERGKSLYGCHPYMPEECYRSMLTTGRIRREDLAAVLDAEPDGEPTGTKLISGTRRNLRLAILEHTLRFGTDDEIAWVLDETDALIRYHAHTSASARSQAIEDTRRWVMRDLDSRPEHTARHVEATLEVLERRHGESSGWDDTAWEAATLELLWAITRARVGGTRLACSTPARPPWLVDLVRDVLGRDVDDMVGELLVRFSLAFLDQGFANWPLPERDAGYLEAFRWLFGAGAPADAWTRGLESELERSERLGHGPLESIRDSLELLGIEGDEVEAYLERTLLVLRGTAGMLWQMEVNGEWTVRPAPAGTLASHVAARLILERVALRNVAARELHQDPSLADLRRRLAALPVETDATDLTPAFAVFQLAQFQGWTPRQLEELEGPGWETLREELERFDSVERRRIYQLAYERRYRNEALDAVLAHCDQHSPVPEPEPDYQVITCIDEREESFRRHVEEVDAACETFGVAGFFGVAMYYRGATEAHYRPLCPVNVKPRHYIDEEPTFTFDHSSRRRALVRRRIGRLAHQIHVGTRTVLGGVLTGLLGSLATLPLVARVLAPRTTATLRRVLGGMIAPQATRLRLERIEGDSASDGHLHGFDVDEMTDIVETLLQAIGLTSRLARLVLVVGHGSSSLNNPHEAAHDCGACGGGRGGPNARAFAEMANDRRVRSRLAARGLSIPDDVHFVGAYHNTCNDAVDYYDLDALPLGMRGLFERARGALDVARRRNAHERCRRFESASLGLDPDHALEHVEGRAEDLSQTRPEYGHATNALCFVGRRSWSRGLFLDRRAFLTSYDPRQDDAEWSVLASILSAVIPVCAGISLEYYFSYVDPRGFGCDTKLPHNISSLIGVMDGAASDLRPGLPWQMVEIHEPMRILFLIECPPAAIEQILEGNADLRRLVHNEWVQIATLDPESGEVQRWDRGRFTVHEPEASSLETARSSFAWYRGQRDHLGFASIHDRPGDPEEGVCA